MPLGEWRGRAERLRFARLIHRPIRVLGVPSAGAACGGNLKPAVATKGGLAVPGYAVHLP
jgi:hypothetical protein